MMRSIVFAVMLCVAGPVASVSAPLPSFSTVASDSVAQPSVGEPLVVAADTMAAAARPRGPHAHRPAWHYIPLAILAAGGLFLGYVFLTGVLIRLG